MMCDDLCIHVGLQLSGATVTHPASSLCAASPPTVPMTQPGSPLTTHILDTARGAPAAGVPIQLSALVNDAWTQLAQSLVQDA